MNQYRVRIVVSDAPPIGRDYDVQASSHQSAINKAMGHRRRPEPFVVVSSRLTARDVDDVWPLSVRPVGARLVESTTDDLL